MIALLPVFALLFTLFPSAIASPSSNSTRRTFGSYDGGSLETCGKAKGWSFFGNFDFGCLCLNDVSDYVKNNNINPFLKPLIDASILATSGGPKWFPDHAQPVCDGHGSFNCGSLNNYKTLPSGSKCPTAGCDPKKTSTNGGCCPRGSTYSQGLCCGSSGCDKKGGKCVPVLTCPTYTSNQICCKDAGKDKSWTGYNTVCCPSDQQEDGSTGKCIPKCKAGTQYNPSNPTDNKCETICDNKAGYWHNWSSEGKDLCCKKEHTPCQTTCCPSGTTEIGHSGVCCSPGSKLDENRKCLSPTKAPKPPTKYKRSFNALPQTIYGLEANFDSSLCPSGFAACPIEGRSAFEADGGYECLDAMTDLQSCGGCASMGTGVDCTAIPGARWMGCSKGSCEVFSCKKGWTKNANGTACDKN
ncbi:hypothetical protein IAR55_003261 [Kwoniella newhampshirensis]|uniref:Protein CPL1-like domain-containing protein n=1 Tax=Kwoniella newhampshirensis TaxID=1651941 RepID=A0AAW0YM01_9TREE